MGGLLGEIKDLLHDRFESYVASRAAQHVVERERAHLETVDAKFERFAARVEAALLAGESRLETLRELERDLRKTLLELEERSGHLKIASVDELLALIASLRDTHAAEPAPRAPTADRREPGAPAPMHGPPPTEADVEAWRPEEDMYLTELDLGREQT